MLRDTDGLKARDPLFLTLVAVPDEPPEVKVRMVGTREPCITPKGRVPFTGTITDDHGLGQGLVHCDIERGPCRNQPATLRSAGELRTAPQQRSLNVPLVKLPKDSAEYADVPKPSAEHAPCLKLQQTIPSSATICRSLSSGKRSRRGSRRTGPGDGPKVSLTVQAADLCTLGNGPNIGSGETWQLDVVTEDQLITRLEAQELLVKQRFEAIIEEMTDTRNLLLKMDFTPPGKGATAAPKAKLAGAEPGEPAEEAPKFSADELNKRRLERTLQALQNCRKNALETADVASAIEEIRLQLDNNQANTDVRKKRIEAQVLQPAPRNRGQNVSRPG